jgi:predicted permease
MPLFCKLRSFLRNLFFSSRAEADLDEEIQAHIAMVTAEKIRAGMSANEAQRAARIELGGIERVKEEVRGVKLGNLFRSMLSDSRYGIRQLRKSPGFTAVAILSLALCIGATTVIFSVVYAVLVDPYPYAGADRIGMLDLSNEKGNQGTVGYSMSEFIEMKARSHTLENMIAVSRQNVSLIETGFPESVVQMDFSPNGFEFFGVPPLLGRTFSSQGPGGESKPEPVAVLSYLFWQRHFAGSREVLGQRVRLNDKFFTVVGVLPRRFTWSDADIYVPMAIRPSTEERVGLIVKRKVGIPKEQLNEEFQVFHEKFSKFGPSLNYPDPPFRTEFSSVNDSILGKFANTLLALLAAVGLLLLIACVNVANLLLARASTRQGEIAVRVSLGAGRKRVIQQLLTESVILSGAGGVLGVALAYGGVNAVVALMPEYSVPHEAVIAINLPVLFFALTVSLLTGILFGLAPALQLSAPNQSTFLKTAGRDSASSTSGRSLRDALIVAEVTLSLVLLTGAALAAAGLLELTKQRLGYQPKGVLTLFVPVPAERFPEWSQRQAFFSDVLENLRKLPGAESVAAAATGVPPYSGADTKFEMNGITSPAAQVRFNLVSEGYFKTMGISLLQGRTFDASDVKRVVPVAVISEDFVKKYFPPGQDPIGRQVRLEVFSSSLPPGLVKSPQGPDSFEIIGISATVRNRGMRDDPEPAIYLPFTTLFPQGMLFAVRTPGDPRTLSNGARQAVNSADPGQAIARVQTLEEIQSNAVAYPRFATFLFGTFGVIGLALASSGIFSVVSYAVSRRTREFGIRMALGASPANVLRLVLGSTGRVLLVGFVLGAIFSVISDRALAGKLEGIGVATPSLLLAIMALLAVAAFLACAIPARSATRVQPMDVLRNE